MPQSPALKTVRNDMKTLVKDAQALFAEAAAATGEKADELRARADPAGSRCRSCPDRPGCRHREGQGSRCQDRRLCPRKSVACRGHLGRLGLLVGLVIGRSK
jgi:ElaB/YqjD/DUF883 family membrane-anchored ribosome-binding protein